MKNSLSRVLRDTPIGYWIAAGVVAIAVWQLSPDPRDLFWSIDTEFVYGTGIQFILRAFLLLAAIAAPVGLFRPVAGLVLALTPCLLLFASQPLTLSMFVAIVGVGVVAAWSSPRLAVLAATIAWLLAMLLVAGVLTLSIDEVYDIELDGSASELVTYALFWTVASVLPVAVSLYLTRVVRRGRALADREEELTGQAAKVDEQATVLGERARLARDLHDVVAHHVSLIAVRAETAPYADPAMPQGSRQVLAEIATDARSALDELRGVLGILQRADGDADRSPLPGLADVTALVERARGAGDDVRLERVGDAAVVNATAGYVAYRVVQEALTNARKHAVARPVTVAIEVSEDVVQLRVSNPADGSSGEGARRGLAGMRERVEGLGGSFSAGSSGGEFVVDARIPARLSA